MLIQQSVILRVVIICGNHTGQHSKATVVENTVEILMSSPFPAKFSDPPIHASTIK